ncbi:MAG TPA: glycosyl hydrolase family 28-related protein, partial [Candidatus Marinimicrobia bacterium]|nr:glycosyl hydrolase family 28-related protein [Candidatus Neomarinimicrobiota bacterium]
MINSKENQVKTIKPKIFHKPILICELIWLGSFGCLASNLQASANEVNRYLSDIPFEMSEIALPKFPERALNVTDFGAIGNGLTMNTTVINDAIKACSQAGGGTVIIPRGLWLTGPLELADNVNLHLQNGALVIFSP